MIPGITGSLLSHDALEHGVSSALCNLLDDTGAGAARRRMHAWHSMVRRTLGPASACRTILDRLATPFFAQLGYRVLPERADSTASLRALLEAGGRPVATLLVTTWGQEAATAWREAVRHGIGHDLRWCFCLTGPALRVFDAFRTYSRQSVEFELEIAIDHDKAFAVLWGLLRAEAMAPGTRDARPAIERAIAVCEDHRAAVRASLQVGVNEALDSLLDAFAHAATSRRRHPPAGMRTNTFNEALIVIYRILFLLFAEARGLVPQWHPIFRDGYTIEALRQPVERDPRPRGLWETIQSIARLAHRGCRLDALQVTPFNGRLFSPVESPLADTVLLDDGAVRRALLALTTRRARFGRERISYSDLGVEQLGGVYERVLDLEPGGERRRTTGSFYTPRSLTEYLVRRALGPLVHDASPDAILSLRVLDPAMGSGAFLVAACRYLAAAYENALVRAGDIGADEITERDRSGFRRVIAQRCLYGVDINPMAVQLGRLSLWLATLAADRPLTFLDHRLRVGNSLVGASPVDLARHRRPGSQRGRVAPLPLFDDPARDRAVVEAIAVRQFIALEPGDTLAEVQAKEQALARLDNNSDDALAKWKDACDLWCAGWFRGAHGAATRPPLGPLMDSLFGRGSLPAHVMSAIVAEARAIAGRERFFHWTFEFPEVFHAPEDGRPGFDAIVGNPPWEMLRGDRGDAVARDVARAAASSLNAFARGSGVYALQGDGHGNLYQLFLERMLSLLRPGGRLGTVLPSGLASDRGAAPLRRTLVERTSVDTLISIENRDGVFPIHRGLKFLLLTTTTGKGSAVLPCRFGVRRPEHLDRLPDVGADPEAIPVPRSLLERTSGETLVIPDVRSVRDLEILSSIALAFPALGDANGWNVRFGRELNATEDRGHFTPTDADGIPVVEGKQLTPFAVDVSAARFRIPVSVAERLLDPDRTFRRARLAYRDVAAATNRLTLLAAIVPVGTLTTHTLFCLRETLNDDDQHFLCGMFNSFVANFLVRLHVGTHVTTSFIERLPMPRPSRRAPDFIAVRDLSRILSRDPTDRRALARLHAHATRLYELDRVRFRHVLDTFPLVADAERDGAMAAFCDIVHS